METMLYAGDSDFLISEVIGCGDLWHNHLGCEKDEFYTKTAERETIRKLSLRVITLLEILLGLFYTGR